MSLHPEIVDGRPGTLVIESFVVDIPEGNTKDETCYFVEALIKCNLKSLADVSEGLTLQDHTEPIDRKYELLITRGWEFGCHGWSFPNFGGIEDGMPNGNGALFSVIYDCFCSFLSLVVVKKNRMF